MDKILQFALCHEKSGRKALKHLNKGLKRLLFILQEVAAQLIQFENPLQSHSDEQNTVDKERSAELERL